MSEATQPDRRFIVYIIGNRFVALPVAANIQPQQVDMLLNTNNWYGTEYATDKDGAILEALAGGFGKSLSDLMPDSTTDSTYSSGGYIGIRTI